MSRRLIIRPEAEDELADALGWYEKHAFGIGDEFLRSVDAVFNAIVRAPQHYPFVHRNIRRALMRRFPFEIFFVEDEARVIVLSVFHAKRHPRHWQARD